MISSSTKYTVVLLGLIVLAHCHPPGMSDLQDLVAAGVEDGEEAEKQAATGATPQDTLLTLAQMLPTILRPLLNNLGAGLTNALTATMMGRAIAFIPPENVRPQSAQGR